MAYQLKDVERDMLAAVLDGKMIQWREKAAGNTPEKWRDLYSLAEFFVTLNDKEVESEFRVKPDGLHTYLRFDSKNPSASLRYGSVKGELPFMEANDRVLHVELDPEDLSLRVCEVLKPEGA